MVEILDWPASIVPSSQIFYAPGEARAGGRSVRGINSLMPEPGGRAYMDAQFAYMGSEADALDAGWLMSAIANGAVFRVPIFRSLQLVDQTSFTDGVDADILALGIPWEGDTSDETMLFDEGIGWDFETGVALVGDVLEGQTSLVLDFTDVDGEILKRGHVIGLNGRAYKVMAIDYDGTEATLKISPPMRNTLSSGVFITFEPVMLATVRDAGSFRSAFEYGFLMKPGGLTFVEALL